MIGRTLSEYRILEEIGGGGMGVVYKAEDLQLKHTVALKFLPRELTRDTDARERFLQEARVAFSLDHPNICTIHGIGETDDGQIFIVMAYYEGETVKQKIARGQLGIEEARSILVQVARGLVKAHEHGIVHRDIKPANILITDDGTVKILDFGLAKLADQTKLTREGTTAGTISYMSPEQARGEDVDVRTDLWSLGAVLYEMLSGQTPFRGEYNEVVLYSILNVEPAEVSTLRSGIPATLLGVCMKCLRKEKSERPGSAQSILDQLGLDPSRTSSKLSVILREPSARRRVLVASLLTVVVCVLWLILPRSRDVPGENPLIAILPFRNLTGIDSVADWIEPLQSMVGHDFRHMGVYTYDMHSISEYLTSTAGLDVSLSRSDEREDLHSRGIGFIIDGNVGRSDSGFTLQMEVEDLESNSFDKTDPVPFRDFSVVEYALIDLIPGVRDFLRLKQISGQKKEDLAPWIRSRPSNIQAHKALMQASFYVYRMEPGGEKFLRRAIELDSLFVTPRVWLISSLVAGGHREEALENYHFLRRIEAGADGFEQAMIDWCGSYIQGDVDAQARHLEMALEYCPGNNILIYNIARMRFIEHNWQATIDVVKPAIRMRWSFSPAYWFYAAASMKLGRFDEARNALEASLGFTPSIYPGNYGLLASLYSRIADSAKAATYREKFILRTRPGGDSLWLAHAELGSIYAEEGQQDEAIGQYRIASGLRPALPEYHDSLAGLYYRSRQYKVASVEYETLLRLTPGAVHAYYFLGMICEESKNNECAVRLYRKYLEIDSLSVRAGEIRERLSGLIP